MASQERSYKGTVGASSDSVPSGPISKRGNARLRYRQVAMLLLGATILALFPLTDPATTTLLYMSTIFMWIALSSSWNIISGHTGYVDFGHGVFFGIGAYTTGILIANHGWSFWPTLPIALLVGVLFAGLVGFPLLRLRGIYFSIAMLGAFMAVREIVRLGGDFTGGAVGLPLIPVYDRTLFYYVYLIAAALIVGIVICINSVQLGFSLKAIREDEEGAESRGINTTRLKQLSFMLSGAFTACIGGIWAYEITFIEPTLVFREIFLATLALVTVFGGLGTIWGPVIGAVLFILIRDTIWAQVPGAHTLVFGLALIVIVLLLPRGIVGTTDYVLRTRRNQRAELAKSAHAAAEGA